MLSLAYGALNALAAATARLLDRRAFHRAKRTKHTTVTRLGAQQGFASCAFVEPLAGIGGHGFLSGKPAVRAGDYGFQDDSR